MGDQGLMMVPFAEIEVGVVDNHRTDMGDIAGLADSIVKNGLLQPLIVQHKHYGGHGFLMPDGRRVFSRHILVAGHRRYEAIKIIRRKKHGAFEKVAVVLTRGNETDSLLAQVAENLDRKDPNPVELAESFRGLINVGLTQVQIAKHTRLSDSYISTLLGIREKCCTAALASLAKGDITIATATDLAQLDEGKQPAQLDKYLGTKKAKGKAAAKRETAKDAGRKVRPSAKEVHEVVGGVIAKLSENGAKDVDKQFWRGAMTAVQCLMGDGDELLELAKDIVERKVA